MDKITTAFAQEVYEGMTSTPKRIASKWFYDEIGDKLFVRIMGLPEYYLTRCEAEIFSTQTEQLVAALASGYEQFDLFELGAGDGSKTMHLLRALDAERFRYRPIDISQHALDSLEARIHRELTDVEVMPLQGEYFHVLNDLETDRPKVILFMGSNIGNLLDDRANEFLRQLSEAMKVGDRLLLGVDLKKTRDVVLPAYNDSQGVTAAFNLNVLQRMNRELGANFDLEQFEHTPTYDEEEGVARSYITSLIAQEVHIAELDLHIHFDQGERIFTEVSRKYDAHSLERITHNTRLELAHKFFDSKHYFCDAVLEKR